MKNIILSLLLFIGFQSFAQQLVYKWAPNKEYTFKAVTNDNISMGGSMIGMGMMSMGGEAMNFKTESVFTLVIDKVLLGGSAEGTFYLNRFMATDGKGNKLATLANIPKRALTAPFLVDNKGNFTFKKFPVLICRENTTFLVEGKVKPNGVAASAEINGEKVSLFAEFNPKTGTLKAGYSEQTIKPTPKKVEVKEDDEKLDLIPTEFLDMLVLPDGHISAGQTIKTKMYGFEMVQKVKDFTNQVAVIDFKFNSGINSKQFEKDAKAMDPDGADDMGMDNDGMETPTIAQDTKGDIQLDFDNGAGMMKKLSGTITSKSNMMGMEMTTKSNLVMVPVVK